jgi:hypothetical protein
VPVALAGRHRDDEDTKLVDCGGTTRVTDGVRQAMSSRQQRLVHEIEAVALTALYFGCWIAGLLVLKHLVLEEYDIAFDDYSKALVGALILSKVVLVLEKVPLGSWSRSAPAWLDVLVRTAFYIVGVLIVLALEKGIEGRHEHGGVAAAAAAALRSTSDAHLWAHALCIAGALLVYNSFGIVRRHLGEGVFFRLFLAPVPAEPATGFGDERG